MKQQIEQLGNVTLLTLKCSLFFLSYLIPFIGPAVTALNEVENDRYGGVDNPGYVMGVFVLALIGQSVLFCLFSFLHLWIG